MSVFLAIHLQRDRSAVAGHFLEIPFAERLQCFVTNLTVISLRIEFAAAESEEAAEVLVPDLDLDAFRPNLTWSLDVNHQPAVAIGRLAVVLLVHPFTLQNVILEAFFSGEVPILVGLALQSNLTVLQREFVLIKVHDLKLSRIISVDQ